MIHLHPGGAAPLHDQSGDVGPGENGHPGGCGHLRQIIVENLAVQNVTGLVRIERHLGPRGGVQNGAGDLLGDPAGRDGLHDRGQSGV